MKQLLFALSITLLVISCSKSDPNVITARNIPLTQAWDSMNLGSAQLYHEVFTSSELKDSSYCIRFLSSSSFVEYHTSTDTLGNLHLLDSLYFTDTRTYSMYQQPDPSNYTTTIGYIYTKYAPTGDTIAMDTIGHNPNYVPAFPFHNYLVKDTLQLYIGTFVTNYKIPTGTFIPTKADSPVVHLLLYR